VTAIGWDGSLSPCLPLLHSHTSYVNERERFSRRYVVGNVNERKLHELWNEPDYLAFRERVQKFDFAPCTICGGCHLRKINERRLLWQYISHLWRLPMGAGRDSMSIALWRKIWQPTMWTITSTWKSG